MDEAKRIELILEAVRYCQRVRAMGMPSSCYSKALRESVHFLWERPGGTGGKHGVAQAHSVASETATDVVYDHSVPFNFLQTELLTLENPNAERVLAVLKRHGRVAIITKDENKRLNAAKLQSKMPSDWDQVDPLARYKAVGIEMVSGPLTRPCGCQCGTAVPYGSNFVPGHDAKLFKKVLDGDVPATSLDDHPALLHKYNARGRMR